MQAVSHRHLREDDAQSWRWRTSRLQASEVTFGPFGRFVATVVFLSPPLLALNIGGPFEILFAVLYAAIVPQGVRWIWQKVQVERLLFIDTAEGEAERATSTPAALIADRVGPSRW